MSYVVLGGVPLRVNSISEDPQIKTSTRALIGGTGSNTKRLGMGGRLITLSVLADNSEIRQIQKLRKETKPLILISESEAEYNGEYEILETTNTEDRKGHFIISLKLQEFITFNITKMDFTNYQVTPRKTGDEVDVGAKWTV